MAKQKKENTEALENEVQEVEVAQITEQQEALETVKTDTETQEQKETSQSMQSDPKEKSQETLIPFQKLVEKYRLPTWQSAAILSLLEKEDDVYLAEKEFLAAIERLYNRKMGA